MGSGGMSHPVGQPQGFLLLFLDPTWESERQRKGERTPRFVEEAPKSALPLQGCGGTLLKAEIPRHTTSSLLLRGFKRAVTPQFRLRTALSSSP